MKPNLQVKITPIASWITVRDPYSGQNNEAYKSVGATYDSSSRVWVLPDNEDNWESLYRIYQAESQTFVAAAELRHLTTKGSQLLVGGYVIARWDTRKSCIRLAEGVELVKGAWDEAKSATLKAHCLVAGDTEFEVRLRRDVGIVSYLNIIGEGRPKTQLSPYSDSDLQSELENRGFKVEPIIC